jgi:hypothetical protein
MTVHADSKTTGMRDSIARARAKAFAAVAAADVPKGAGIGGVGAVGVGSVASLALPLFSSGPSATQRRKNEKLDADYQLRLRRIEDRVLQRHDSIRADSLRRDSLARRAKPAS